MEAVQASLAAEAADAIVGFLHRVHRQERTPPPLPVQTFDDNSAFNDHVDETFGPFAVFDVAFRPSEVLFRMEPETYRIYLAEFDCGDAETAAPEEEAQPERRGVTESVVEQAAPLGWKASAGPWSTGLRSRRASWTQNARTTDRSYSNDASAMPWLADPMLPSEAQDDEFRKLLRPEGAELILQNRTGQRLLVDGVTVEYRDGDAGIRGAQARGSTSNAQKRTTGWP